MDEPYGATPITPADLQGLRVKHITLRGQLDELEQANIQNGLLWLKKQRSADLLSPEFVCKLHKKLFGEVWQWAGCFRKAGTNIGSEPYYIAIELRDLFDDARYWIENQTFEPKEIAVRFHHRLVKIHPFPNGNGRHARIMADAILTHKLGQPEIDWAGGQDLQRSGDRRKLYIKALRAADRGDFGALLAFVGLPPAEE